MSKENWDAIAGVRDLYALHNQLLTPDYFPPNAPSEITGLIGLRFLHDRVLDINGRTHTLQGQTVGLLNSFLLCRDKAVVTKNDVFDQGFGATLTPSQAETAFLNARRSLVTTFESAGAPFIYVEGKTSQARYRLAPTEIEDVRDVSEGSPIWLSRALYSTILTPTTSEGRDPQIRIIGDSLLAGENGQIKLNPHEVCVLNVYMHMENYPFQRKHLTTLGFAPASLGEQAQARMIQKTLESLRIKLDAITGDKIVITSYRGMHHGTTLLASFQDTRPHSVETLEHHQLVHHHLRAAINRLNTGFEGSALPALPGQTIEDLPTDPDEDLLHQDIKRVKPAELLIELLRPDLPEPRRIRWARLVCHHIGIDTGQLAGEDFSLPQELLNDLRQAERARLGVIHPRGKILLLKVLGIKVPANIDVLPKSWDQINEDLQAQTAVNATTSNPDQLHYLLLQEFSALARNIAKSYRLPT